MRHHAIGVQVVSDDGVDFRGTAIPTNRNMSEYKLCPMMMWIFASLWNTTTRFLSEYKLCIVVVYIMPTYTVKYEIIKPIDVSWQTFSAVLRQVRYAEWRARNYIMTRLYEWEQRKDEHYKMTGENLTDENVFGQSFQNELWQQIKIRYPEIITNNISVIVDGLCKKWRGDSKKENGIKHKVFKGEMSLPTFRKDGVISIYNKGVRFKEYTDNGKMIADISLLSREGVKILKKDKKFGDNIGTSFRVLINPGDRSKKTILERIRNSQYKQGSSEIVYNKHKSKWMLHITYTFKNQQERVQLSTEKILGVDLGIVNAVYMATNFDEYWSDSISGREITAFRKKVESLRRHFQTNARLSKGGHGRKKRLASADKIGDREARFRDTCNHKYSKYIIEMAKKMECGVIQMEDLAGVSEHGDTLLKNWPYHDLQTKIKYKFEAEGGEVKFINPMYTSQRCFECGYINKDNRPNQALFKCVNCGHTSNADYNAARNIALPNIEAIIEEQCKKQGLPYKKKESSISEELTSV
jgi:putative transposase